jgi:hypothetical protein
MEIRTSSDGPWQHCALGRDPYRTLFFSTNTILAEHAGLSESHFHHMFLQAIGMSPIRYVQQQRIERARELLANTNLPIAHLASECGFVSQSYLTTCFRETYGMTPARCRRAARQGMGQQREGRWPQGGGAKMPFSHTCYWQGVADEWR